MYKAIVLAAALALASPVLAEEAPPAVGAMPGGPQSVTIPFTDIQAFADKVMELPYKQAAPLLQELQRIVAKNSIRYDGERHDPTKPPEASERPAKK